MVIQRVCNTQAKDIGAPEGLFSFWKRKVGRRGSVEEEALTVITSTYLGALGGKWLPAYLPGSLLTVPDLPGFGIVSAPPTTYLTVEFYLFFRGLYQSQDLFL